MESQTSSSPFLHSLKKDPSVRSQSDVQSLYYTLRTFTCLDRLTHQEIYQLSAKNCYYMKKQANDILYCRGEVANSWFILISGSVFIDGSMFLPITSFGKRPQTQYQMTTRRPNECLILEPSEMICIDYFENCEELEDAVDTEEEDEDTSSAYSGSDNMFPTSTTTNSQNNASQSSSSNSNNNNKNVDLSGLLESVVDSTSNSEYDSDDDGSDSELSVSINDEFFEEDRQSLRDSIRECLEKDPSERTEADIQILLEFTQHLAAFNDLTLNVRKALVAVMVFAVVERAGTIVLSPGEELDSWSVLVNGSVEISSLPDNQSNQILSAGDSFGNCPTLEKQYFKGVMRTRVDDCQFVCVTQGDYFRILKQGLDSQKTIYNPTTKKPILILESRQSSDQNYFSNFVILRGTKDALISELFKQENGSVDPTFVEDFLLTQRIFMEKEELAEKIIESFSDVKLRDRVTRVMLLWVNNHFCDFEDAHPTGGEDGEGLMVLLQRFQSLLEQTKETMSGQLRLLQIACSAKSRARSVTLSRATREDPLPFNIMGGSDSGYGIFISSIENNAVKIGDEVLSVNNTPFRNITLSKAMEILKASTHLVLVVKCNFLGYHECRTSAAPLMMVNRAIVEPSIVPLAVVKRNKFRKALVKLSLFKKEEVLEVEEEQKVKVEFPENVLRIYSPSQSHKYLLVNKETTAREVVMLAIQELFLEKNSKEYSLFQVSVSQQEGNYLLKQTRLPESLDSLAERLQLGSRYYVKKNDSTEPLVPNELLADIFKESEVSLLNLNPVELALQLTLEDYALFRQILPTEFIDDLFKLKKPQQQKTLTNLQQFAELVNRETFWVVTEIVRETNINKRALIIKRFIKVALQCKECRNYNSMFAIVSGLGHCSVSRLKETWGRVVNRRVGGDVVVKGKKYGKVFKDLQSLMDPTLNMRRYRTLITSTIQTPMIPFYPIINKDLTFIHLGNSTMLEDGLINFEKMRMVAKEIRSLIQMSAAPFDTSGLQASVASMNQLSGGDGGAVDGGRTLTSTRGKLLLLGNKKNKKHHHDATPNAKKLYEETNMIRKVKAYLHRLKIIQDETKLDELSLLCEGGGVSAMPVNKNKPLPSPTLSSHSNREKGGGGGSFFGERLMALSEPNLSGGQSQKGGKVGVVVVGGGVGSKEEKVTTASSSSSSSSSSNSTKRLLLLTEKKSLLLEKESSSVLPASSSSVQK